MKKFILVLCSFIFSFIFVDLVSAMEIDVLAFGFSTCPIDSLNSSTRCYLETDGNTVYSSTISSNSHVSDFILINSDFSILLSKPFVSSYRICFYDSDRIFISCRNLGLDVSQFDFTFDGSYSFIRFSYNNGNGRILLVDDISNSSQLSSFGSAINSLSVTLSNFLDRFTWVFLLSFSIVVIGFIIALILRVGK